MKKLTPLERAERYCKKQDGAIYYSELRFGVDQSDVPLTAKFFFKDAVTDKVVKYFFTKTELKNFLDSENIPTEVLY